ncbi:MAG: glycosyltransferase [Planctomycetes bacterium]|nr:glycosyltransferase [Planctomycetota bacterium]
MSRVRVAYLLKKFPRLSETFILNELLGQERAGRELRVFSRRTPDPEPRHPELARLKAPVELVSVDTMQPWMELFGPTPAHHALLERFGTLVREMSEFQHPRMPALFAEALVLLRRTRELGIEHVHVHFATDSALTAMLLHELGGPGYSVTAHAKDIYRSTVDPRLFSRIVARSRFVVTVCDANVKYMEGILTAEARPRVRRLYNGIDLESFAPRPVQRDDDHVLCVARLVEKKGFIVLVEAIELLRRRNVAVQATFVGEGEDRARIEGRIAELGLGERIRLVGAQDQEAVRGYMARATMQVLPCIVGEDGNRDALPTTLIEAQAMGLPCISTPVTGIPEILDHGRAGLLVAENSVVETADAIERLLRDRTLRAELARAGRARAEALFDARKTARTLYDWFEGVGVAHARA